MKKAVFILLALVLVSGLALGAGIVGASDWPQFHNDAVNSGVSDSQAPDTNALAWTFFTGAGVESSPAVDKGVVYAANLAGTVFALSAPTGAQLWSYNTDAQIHSSPAVALGNVYILAENGVLYAIDAMTGLLSWDTSIGSGPWDWSSPAVNGGNVFVGSSNGYMHSLNGATGAINWSTPVGGSPNSMIAVANGKVYTGTHNFDNSAPTMVALDEATGAIIWTYDYYLYHSGIVGMVNCNGAAVVDGDSDGDLEVYFGVYNWGGVDDQAICLDEATGTEVWTTDIGDDSTSTPAVHNGMVFIGSEDGKVYALNAATGAAVWTFQTGNQVWASPAVADGKVFVGSRDHTFYALDETTGALVWSYYTGASQLVSSPAVADGMVFVGNENGKVYAFHPISVEKTIFDSTDYGDGDGILELGERWEWVLQITVTNNDDSNTLEDVVLKDNLGGDLKLVSVWDPAGWQPVPQPANKKDAWDYAPLGFSVYWTGKTLKAHMSWDVGDLGPGESATYWIKIETDINTGDGNGKKTSGHQEYTSPGQHCLNSGATAMGIFLDREVVNSSDPICVTVVEPVING